MSRATGRQKKAEMQSFMLTFLKSTPWVCPVPTRSTTRPAPLRSLHPPGPLPATSSVSVMTTPTGRLKAMKVAASCIEVPEIDCRWLGVYSLISIV